MSDYSKIIQEQYPELLGLMIELVNAKAGQPIPDGQAWRNDAQTLAMKLFKHLVSMHNLSGGSTVTCNGVELQQIDHGSIIVIARAALETFLVWNYLYGTDDSELGRYRYLTWRLGGLMDRQNLHAVSQHGRQVQASDLREIEDLRRQISEHPQAKTFSAKQLKAILKGDWKTAMGMSDLAANANLHGSYFSNTYSYLCGYSHASYISALQIGQAITLDDQERMTRTIIGIGFVVLAHFVCKYPVHFPETLPVLNARPELKLLAQRFAFTEEDMARTYAR